MKKKRVYRTINNGLIKWEEVAGYCHCTLHTGYLLSKHLKKHKCIQKNCVFFEQFKNCPYYKEKVRVKETADAHRKINKMYMQGVITKEQCDKFHSMLNNGCKLEKIFEKYNIGQGETA